MKLYQFTTEDYRKLSEILGYSELEVTRLACMGLLDNTRVLHLVWRYDYDRLMKMKIGTRDVICRAIANKYGVALRKVKNVLFRKTNRSLHCEDCHIEITTREYNQNNGRCNNCAAKYVPL